MDNVMFHKTTEVKNNLRSKNILFDFIPPYSPELNPIEEVFSSLKMNYYNLPNPQNFKEISENIRTVIKIWNNENMSFSNFYDHSRRYLDKAFMREPF